MASGKGSTEEDSDDSWVNVSTVQLFLVAVHPCYSRLKGRKFRKTVVVVVVVNNNNSCSCGKFI